MGGSKSADDVLAELRESMGEELGPVFHLLSGELTWLCWRWNEFVELFATKESRLDLINRSASFFFHVVQQTLWYDTVLAISRLAGPEATGSHPNLAIRRVLPLIPDEVLRGDVHDRVRAMGAACEFVTPWRNKHIAHRDFELAMGRLANPLPEVTKEKIDSAIDSMVEVMNHVQGAYQKSTTAYRFAGPVQGAESLLYTLRDGLRREEVRQAKLEAGDYDPDDWNDHLPAV